MLRKNTGNDYLKKVRAVKKTAGGAVFMVDTSLGNTAEVTITFVSEDVYRFRMFAADTKDVYENPVYEFDARSDVTLTEEPDVIILKSGSNELRIRRNPWEVTACKGKAELVKEQIRDRGCGQEYVIEPVGFERDETGSIAAAYETFYAYSEESLYGFGEKFTGFDKRGQRIQIWQADVGNTCSERSYKGMPLYVSSAGYAFLLNTFTKTEFDMGATSSLTYVMRTEDPYLDYYVFLNGSIKGFLGEYTELAGRPPMPPKWAFGFWMSKMSYVFREEVESVAEQIRNLHMPANVINIDGWMDCFLAEGQSGEYLHFDEARFPDPEGMIRGLREKGFRLCLWMFPYVYPRCMLSETEWGEQSLLFKNLSDRGFLVKKRDGTPYIFHMTPGNPTLLAAIDFTNPKACAYVRERIKMLIRMGVGALKTDFSEEIPEDAVFYDGSTGLTMHNKYPYLYQKTVYEACAEAKRETGERPMLWGRSGYLGTHLYPGVWAGDSASALNNLACVLRGGLSIGMCGFSFWGFDIGGFYNADYEGKSTTPSEEEYIRSVQMGMLAPLSRAHGQMTPREPWNYSAKALQAFLKADRFRYQILPYLYSTACEAHRTGVPMMRAMVMEFEEDPSARTLDRQYMMGSALLVAPVFDNRSFRIYLPAGDWLDLVTKRIQKGGTWVAYSAPPEDIPVYLRENSILPELQAVPETVGEEAFCNIRLLIHIRDAIQTVVYDDGTEYPLQASLQKGVFTLDTEDMDVAEVLVYSAKRITRIQINNSQCDFERTADGGFSVRCK